MKRRTFDISEHTGSSGRSFLTEPGDWFIEERLEDVILHRIGRFTFQAAVQWASTIEGAVKNFIEDNRQVCTYCLAEWVVVDDLPALFCPRCARKQST